MDNYEPGVAFALARIAELYPRPTSGASPAASPTGSVAVASGPGRGAEEAAMLIQHQHRPGEFDPGHCLTCAHQAGLLDYHDRVQREETRLHQTSALAYAARRYAFWALGSSGVGILLSAVALLTR